MRQGYETIHDQLILYSHSFGEKVLDKSKILIFQEHNFFMVCFTGHCLQFCSTFAKICFFDGHLSSFASILSVSGVSLIFPNFQKLFDGNSLGNLYIQLLVIQIWFPCTYSEQKLCLNLKNSANIFCMTVYQE